MIKQALTSLIVLAALTTASAAHASDTVAPDSGAQLTALDASVVWISGSSPGQTLMQRRPDGTVARVKGTPKAIYPAVDLGRDGKGALVLTYVRCASSGTCKAFSDDLAGHSVAFKNFTPPRCDLSAVPARWGSRVAYGLVCSKLGGKPNVHDPKRSGLFVRTGAGAARRLRLPTTAQTFVPWVDLRGSTVGAVAAGDRSYVFSQTVDARRLRSLHVNPDQAAVDGWLIMGMSLGSGGRLFTLVSAFSDGSLISEVISRIGPANCTVSQQLPLTQGSTATSLAVDGDTLYLSRGSGAVTHQFSPAPTCG